MKLKIILITYIVFLHLILFTALIKTDIVDEIQEKLGMEPLGPELDPHYQTMLAFHERSDKNLPDGAVVFMGDSHIQGLSVTAVAKNSVNYGIGNDTTVGMLNRIQKYTKLDRAQIIVIMIGVNDLKRRKNSEIKKNIKDIISRLPNNIPLLLAGIFPVEEKISGGVGNNKRISELNAYLEDISGVEKNVYFLRVVPEFLDENGSLSHNLHIGDGVHLNKAGYERWIAELKRGIEKIRKLG